LLSLDKMCSWYLFTDEKDSDNRRDGGSIPTGSSAEESPENTVVEDFDDSANALWSLYAKVAKSHDEATVETIKDGMDGALIFVHSSTSSRLWAWL
jgi:hypothetical protein